jgi:hypothetical protein
MRKSESETIMSVQREENGWEWGEERGMGKSDGEC